MLITFNSAWSNLSVVYFYQRQAISKWLSIPPLYRLFSETAAVSWREPRAQHVAHPPPVGWTRVIIENPKVIAHHYISQVIFLWYSRLTDGHAAGEADRAQDS